MPTHTKSKTFNDGSGALTQEDIITDDGKIEFTVTFGANQTNKQVNLACSLADISSIFLRSSVAMTLETNDSTTPADTIELAAGKAFEWDETMPLDLTDYLSADITVLYGTNVAAGTLYVKVLLDVSP